MKRKAARGSLAAFLKETTAPQNPVTVSTSALIWDRTWKLLSDFVSVADIARETLARHPWSIGGGGASDVKLLVEKAGNKRLGDISTEIGFGAITREDDQQS